MCGSGRLGKCSSSGLCMFMLIISIFDKRWMFGVSECSPKIPPIPAGFRRITDIGNLTNTACVAVWWRLNFSCVMTYLQGDGGRGLA